jgi:hypothetical protein
MEYTLSLPKPTLRKILVPRSVHEDNTSIVDKDYEILLCCVYASPPKIFHEKKENAKKVWGVVSD